MGRKFGFSWRRATGLSAAKGKLSRAIGVPLTKGGRQRKAGCLGSMGGCVVGIGSLGLIAIVISICAGLGGPGRQGTQPAAPVQAAAPVGPSLLPEVRTWLEEHGEFGSPVSSEAVPDWARGKRQAVTMSDGSRLLLYLGDEGVMTAYDMTPGHDRVKVWGEQSTPDRPGGRRKGAEPDGVEVIDGLTVEKRKEIYGLLYRGGLDASAEAERRYPFDGMPTGEGEGRAYLAKRKSVYETVKKKAREALVFAYKVDGATLDRIDDEGTRKDWPSAPAGASRPLQTSGPDIKVGVAAEPDPAEAKAADSKRAEAKLLQAKALELRNPKGALEYYRAIVEDFPDSPAAKTAAERIAVLEKKKKP